MTVFAGVYSRRPGDVVPESLCLAVARAVSRHSGERLERFRDERCFLVKMDIGAYGERAVLEDAHAISMLTGEALLGRPTGAPRSRAEDLTVLHDACRRSEFEPLRSARGVFAAAHYDKASSTLVLLTDKLGIRPVYYWVGPRYVVFANALRIMEEVPEVPKVMELRAVTEIASLGFALGARTAFESIRLLRSAEILTIRGDASTHEQYWRWDAIPVSDRPVAELAAEAYHHFTDAIALRNRSDATTVGFLSGGLDSRSIVTVLRDRGVKVHTFNISHPGTQDAMFGAEFARRVGAIHTQVGVARGETRRWAKMIAEAWNASRARVEHPAERPALVWSGDGGSVGIGHVYLDESIVALARRGDVGAAVTQMSRFWGGAVPARLLQPDLSAALKGVVRQGWLDELAGLQCGDIGRCLHVLLMQNDQRRHLSEFYETIDLYRLEYQLPFFDSEFLTAVMKAPVDACLGHGFYMKWLRNFPDVVFSVPWQTYPGHEPCPLPVVPEHKYQWGDEHGRDVREARRRALLEAASELLRAPRFPVSLLNRRYVRLAAWMYRLRLRDVGYFLEAAKLYSDYWSRAAGKYTLASTSAAGTAADALTGVP